MHGEDALRRIATQALEATRADQAEIVISADESALTRFASSTIHQNVFEAGIEVRVRAVLGTRIGVATTTRTDERALRETAHRAAESARYVPENPDFKGLPGPQPITPVSAYSSATAAYTPERRALDVKGVCDQAIARGLDASGAWSTGELELGNATALDAAVQLVSAQRAYDASMQALQTYRSMDQRAVEVARVK